jgi:hypothetical protein
MIRIILWILKYILLLKEKLDENTYDVDTFIYQIVYHKIKLKTI